MGAIIFFGIVGIALIIFISHIIATKFERVAFMKGYTKGAHAYAMCLLFGVVGYLYVISLPNLNANENSKENKESSNPDANVKRYKCTLCDESIVKGTKACPRCHQPIDWTDYDN